MSLFGGSVPLSHPTRQSDPLLTANTQSSLLPEEHPSLQNAQLSHGVNQSLELGDDDDDTSTDSSSETSKDSKTLRTRPNRFSGRPQTWKGYTASDRQIVASIERLQDADLAAHLFNAHALKRRVRRPIEDMAGLQNWQTRDSWVKKGKDLEYTDLTGLLQTELVPYKDWTAWPLPPAQLPNLDARPGIAYTNGIPDQWTIGGTSTPDAGDELREELLAVFLRLAKERWGSREVEDQVDRGGRRTTASRSRSRSKSALSAKSYRSTSRSDVEMKNDNLRVHDNENQGNEAGLIRTAGKRRGRKFQVETNAKPTVLADDSSAQRLLQPTIHSMLSDLDHLALAVRRTRLNHFARGESSDRSSLSDFTSDADTVKSNSPSSSRDRSRNVMRGNPRSRQSSRAMLAHEDQPLKLGRNNLKGRQGAPQSDTASNDESNSEALQDNLLLRKRRRSGSMASIDTSSSTRDESRRAGLLDWSEILGLAAVKGWDERAIARTTQRCATLFGESMSFVPFDESLASTNLAKPIHYIPSHIPSPNEALSSSQTTTKRPFFQIGTLRCPHTDCYGHTKDFALPYRVVEHCMRVHGYDPRTNDSDNEERVFGGVHIDGYLQPVTLKPGWLGHGRSKAGKASKKQKIGEEDGAATPNAIATIEDHT